MGSRGGGGSNGGGVQGIPAASRKMVQSLKEIVNGVSDAEIYSALKDCNMDPNEAVNRLLSQDPFHEVKSKREKKKELKDTTEARPRGGGSTSTRGGRSSTDRYSARGGSSQYNSSESGGLHGKSKRENGTSSYTNSYTSSSAPAYGIAATNTNRGPQTYSGSVGYENKASNFNATDGNTTVPQQPSSGYQSAWLGAPGQKSMADIVKMGKPQNKPYNAPVQSQPQSTYYEDYVSKPIDTHQEHDSGADNFVSPDDDWPVMEQSQPVHVQSVSEPHVESENIGQSNSQYIGSQIDDDVQEEDESGFEDQTTNHVQDNDSFYQEDHAFEHKEVEENDASASSISGNMQQLNIQEERQLDESEEEIPSVVIPNHLQVQTADCSHLSFGSFGAATMNQQFSGSFSSQQLVDPNTSSVAPSETRNSEYYNEESIITSDNNRVGPNSGNYELPTASQTEVLKQENPQMTPGNQYSYTFDSPQLLNPSFPQSQTSTQLPNTTPFSNVMQGAYTNSLPNTLLAANGRESDLSYSQFPISQSMAAKYGSSVSPITGSTISMAEALKTGVFSSSSQPTQQTPAGNTIPTGPTLPQHLAVHPYSQQPLPLSPFTNMIYPFLPQSYTYMPSGFQQAFAAGNSTYHQQLAAVLPQYKNSVPVTQSAAAVPSGYGSFGNSATIPGNYQVNQPAGSTLSYDDVLNAHYKENSQLLSLQQQQNDNSAMWVHGAGSRTMSGMPASTYYGFQGQTQQQPTGFRQGQQQLQQQQQQPTQSYGGQAAAHNYPNYYHSQSGISQEHQLQQNPRDSVGGQPKPQQQLWQNSY